MIDISHGPRQNHLLDALPREQWERRQSHLEFIDKRLGAVLYEPGIAGPSRGARASVTRSLRTSTSGCCRCNWPLRSTDLGIDMLTPTHAVSGQAFNPPSLPRGCSIWRR
jgi:hypothetical protein